MSATQILPSAQATVAGDKVAEQPALQPDNAEPFAIASRVMLDSNFNPSRKTIGPEQRHELQALIDQANKDARELQAVIGVQVEEHVHLMIARGEGTPLPRGQ